MKQKTHSGAKKRYRRTGGMKVKRKQAKRRHLLTSKNHKAKRNLAAPAYVNDANMYQVRRQLVF